MKLSILLRPFRRKTESSAPTADPAQLQAEIEVLTQRLKSSMAAHAGMSRRASALYRADPDTWALYFTKAGDKRRQEQRNAVA